MEQEMLEKDKCPLPLMQNSQGLHLYNEISSL